MTPQTEAVIRASVGGDPSVSPKCLELALKVLRGEPLAPPPPPDDDLHDLIPYGEARRLLHVKRTTFHEFIKRKKLVRVMGPGSRGIGVTRKSLARLLDGYIRNGHY